MCGNPGYTDHQKVKALHHHIHKLQTFKNAVATVPFRQDGTREIYFRVPSKTTPTTNLVAVIKAHRNRKTNLNAKTNYRKLVKRSWKKNVKKL